MDTRQPIKERLKAYLLSLDYATVANEVVRRVFPELKPAKDTRPRHECAPIVILLHQRKRRMIDAAKAILFEDPQFQSAMDTSPDDPGLMVECMNETNFVEKVFNRVLKRLGLPEDWFSPMSDIARKHAN
ncbi:MAG: hypothetical protein WC641_01715 [Patescibacteria group bacterium]